MPVKDATRLWHWNVSSSLPTAYQPSVIMSHCLTLSNISHLGAQLSSKVNGNTSRSHIILVLISTSLFCSVAMYSQCLGRWSWVMKDLEAADLLPLQGLNELKKSRNLPAKARSCMHQAELRESTGVDALALHWWARLSRTMNCIDGVRTSSYLKCGCDLCSD